MAARAAALAAGVTDGPVVVVANRVADDADRLAVEQALPGRTVLLVPEDPAVPAADRDDRAPIDASPGSPALLALGSLAGLLLPG